MIGTKWTVISMEQKTNSNMKIIVIAGIVVAAVLIVAVLVFTSGIGGGLAGGGLSGRYELYNEQFNYSKQLDFSAIGNKVTVRGIDSRGDIKGTYTIEDGNKLTITGDNGLDWLWGRISEDKQTIFINGVGTFTKK
jgi:hypothetical protein